MNATQATEQTVLVVKSDVKAGPDMEIISQD
jgi:hypothetical protein